jgi:hypothetical protein
MIHQYYTFQLVLNSVITLPELLRLHPADNTTHSSKVSIQFGQNLSLENPKTQGLYYRVRPDYAWFEIPNLVRFLIAQGEAIDIEPLGATDEETIRFFLYTVALPCLLVQRGYFLLHGAALYLHRHAIAFLTHFSQGKSTLLTAFLQQHQAHFISDDFCALSPSGVLLPGIPCLHLYENTLKQLNISKNALRRTRPSATKWSYPVINPHTQPELLKAIYVIKPSHHPDLRIKKLFGFPKVQHMSQYIYYPDIIKGLDQSLFYFQQNPQLATQISMAEIERPENGFQLNELIECITKDVLCL